MKRPGIVIAFFAALAGLPAPARACSCVAESVEQAIGRAAAIFEGRVASVEEGPEGRVVRFDVVQSWRAAGHEHVEVRTASSETACGFPFEVGRSYLVYASLADGVLSASLCSRTRRIEEADEDRQALGSGSIPVDIEDGPEEAPAQRLPPRGGCAGCTAGAPRPPWALAPLLLLAARARRR